MSINYEDMLRNMAEASQANNPFADFTSTQKKHKARTFSWGQGASSPIEEPPDKASWFRATVYGFIGHLSTRGWTVSRRRLGSQHIYTWRSSRGQLLETKITGDDAERVLAHACGLLAGWEPDLMYWQAAFKEVGVPTSTR